MKPIKLLLLVMLIVSVSLPGAIFAQDTAPVEAIDFSSEPVVVAYNTSAAGPPTVEPTTDGRITFRITAVGDVSGALEGSITARVSEAYPMESGAFHYSSVMFSIETEQGVVEGFYAGSFHFPEGASNADVTASGKILSVSGAYADLYLADVFVSSQVQFEDGRSVGETGTITIAAR